MRDIIRAQLATNTVARPERDLQHHDFHVTHATELTLAPSFSISWISQTLQKSRGQMSKAFDEIRFGLFVAVDRAERFDTVVDGSDTGGYPDPHGRSGCESGV